jgi:hypothetical protein
MGAISPTNSFNLFRFVEHKIHSLINSSMYMQKTQILKQTIIKIKIEHAGEYDNDGDGFARQIRDGDASIPVSPASRPAEPARPCWSDQLDKHPTNMDQLDI